MNDDYFNFDDCLDDKNCVIVEGYDCVVTNGDSIIYCLDSEPTTWELFTDDEDTEQKRIEELSKLSYKKLQKLNNADRTAVMRFRSKQGKRK